MQALGVTPWTVENSAPRKRRGRHSVDGTSREQATRMDVSRVVEFVKTTDPFCSLLGDSITVDLEHSCSSIDCHHRSNELTISDSEQRKTSSALTEYNLVEVRLSLVGLGLPSRGSLSSSQSSKSSIDGQRDELHSHLYSSVLETVRVQLIECVPQITEEMISKAIINAFADSNKTHSSILGGGYNSARPNDKYQVEVDCLWKAVQLRDSRQNTTQELKLLGFRDESSALQAILDDTFVKIRNEAFVSPNQVLRVVLAFLSLLQIETDNFYLLRDTILLQGLPPKTTRRSLRYSLSQFGEISAVAIASRDPGFAYCRFRDESSALQAILSSDLSFEGTLPRMSLIQDYHNKVNDCVGTSPTVRMSVPRKEAEQVSPVCVSKHISDAFWRLDTPARSDRPMGCTLPD